MQTRVQERDRKELCILIEMCVYLVTLKTNVENKQELPSDWTVPHSRVYTWSNECLPRDTWTTMLPMAQFTAINLWIQAWLLSID